MIMAKVKARSLAITELITKALVYSTLLRLIAAVCSYEGTAGEVFEGAPVLISSWSRCVFS